MRCAYYCTAEGYQADKLVDFLKTKGAAPKFYNDAISVRRREEEGDVFYFTYGCVVFWGFEEEEELQILRELEPYAIGPIERRTHDLCSYHYGAETTIVEEEDEIVLEPNDVLIKLSMSHGLAQSVKLAIFENSTDRTIENTKYLPAELAEKGKISLSRKKISQKLGALFVERNSINLHTDILDTPEFFWRRPRYEPYYEMVSEYMDLSTRLDILNRRLDVIRELYEILSEELKHAHSSRLEMVIIYLIFLEVVVAVFKDVLHWIFPFS